VCTYAGDFSLFFTVPSVTVPYLFLVTGDMVTIELVNIPCVRACVRTQEGFFLFLLSPRHLVIFRSTSSRLQSKNVPLDLWSLAKQECFCRKDTTNETLQSDFPFVSFFSFLFVRFVRFVLFAANCTPTFRRLIVIAIKKSSLALVFAALYFHVKKPFPPIMLISFQIPPKDLSIQFLSI